MAEQEQLQLETPAAEPSPPEQRQVTINLDEVGDDDEDKGSQGPAATTEERAPRRQQQRDIRRQRDEYARDLAQLRTEMAELRGRMSVPQAAPGGGQAANDDPIAAEIESIEEQQQALLQAIQAPGQSQDGVAKLYTTWRKMETHRRRLETRQILASEKQESGGADQDEDRYIKAAIAAEFPQVWTNRVMTMRAGAEMQDLLDRGKPRSLETAREACRRVLGRNGVGQRPPGPTDLERSRYAGIPSRAGVAGNGAGNQYQPNKFEMNLAKAFTKHEPDLSDEERWRRWAKRTGSMPKSAG